MEEAIKKIEERIKKLEENDKSSRIFCKMLDESNEEDKKLLDTEKELRKMRIFATLELKGLLEEIKAKSN